MATPPNITVTLTAEDRGVSAAIQALTVQLQELSQQQKAVATTATEAAVAEEGMAASMHEARGAAALLGEETGVHLSRHLRSVLAESELLGPVLAAAFPIAAALGFAEVIVHVTEKITEWVSETFIFTEQMKELDKQIRAENTELVNLAKAHAEALHEQELAGKSAVDQAKLRKQWTDEATESTKKDAAAVETRRAALIAEINTLQQRKEATEPMLAPAGGEGFAIENPEVTEISEKIAKAQEELQKLPAAGLGQARVQAALDNSIAAQQKLTEAAEAEAEKQAKAHEEAAKRAAAAWKKFLDERFRLAMEQQKLADDEAKFFAGIQEKESIAASKELDKRLEADAKFRDEQKKNEEQRAVDAISLQQREVQARAARKEIDSEEELKQLEDLSKQKLAIETAYLDERIKEVTSRFTADNAEAYARDVAAYSQLLAQKRAADDRYNAELQTAADRAAKALSPMQEAQKIIGKDLEKFFTEGIAHARSFGDAMRGLAESVISGLQKMAAQFLLTAIQKKLFEGEGEGGGGILGFLGGLFGAGAGHAAGGVIEGPGGPKSDIIPAMLSAGEFVMSADAVKALGAANLEALNKAGQTPAITGGYTPHFAEGGFTGGELSSSSEINMGIGLDEGLILRHLGSKAAAKVILQHLTNNPKAAQRALQRTE